MNPTKIEESIKDAIVKQTLSLRPVHVACPAFAEEYKTTIENYKYLSSPYLEKIPYYAQDANTTLKSLYEEKIDENNPGTVLEEETAMLFAAEFGQKGHPGKVNLYSHQAEAVRAAAKGENLIICTGTGSGKTESFLIPVINSIIKERKKSAQEGTTYQKGVRVMILYPMNALVNDQVRRLRSVIRHAVNENIDYAKDITYGIFTSELNKRERRKPQLATDLDQAAYLAQNNDHPFLSGNESPANEYTSRRRWINEGPADILITNYSMLEHLMLDPDRQNIFYNGAATWKYIVLDEAHTYDGAVGTDVAWLVRRVAQRTQAGNQLRYIATSATLVDDDSEPVDKIERIQKEFACKIFPAAPESFSVQLGSVHEDDWSGREQKNPRSFVSLLEKPASNLVAQLKEALNEVKNQDLKRVFDLVLSSEKLVDFTKRLIELRKWLKNQCYVANLDLNENQPLSISWGDAYWLAGFLQSINRDNDMSFVADPVLDVIARHLQANNYSIISTSNIKSKLGITSTSEAEHHAAEFKRFIKEVTNQTRSIKASSFTILSELIQSSCLGHFNVASLGLRISDSSVAVSDSTVAVSDSTVAVLAKLKSDLAMLLDYVASLFTGSLKDKWNNLLDTDALTCEQSISQYLKRGSELKRFLDALQDKPAKRTMSNIALKVFGKDKAEDDLDAFAQLLALSEHDKLGGKPLMDIRYHQTVTGISNISVVFAPTEDGNYRPLLRPDAQEIRDAKTGYPLYPFAVCYQCGHPFIQVYGSRQNNDISLSRYQASFEDGEQVRKYTFSWAESKDEGRETVQGDTYYFNPSEGKLIQAENNPGPGYIPVYHCKVGQVASCTVCGGITSTGDVIAPFKTGFARLKTGILYSLVENTDPEVCSPAASIAGGRKLLAFSDSRDSAARLAVNFERYSEERLVEKMLVDLVKIDADLQTTQTYLQEPAHNEAFKNDKLNEKLIAYNTLRQYGINNEPLQQVQQEINNYLKDSLLTLLSPLKERLNAIQAYSFYEKESDCHMLFSEPASLSLCALGALRNKNRRGLISCNAIKVYSKAQRDAVASNDADWQDISNHFETPEKATEFFDFVYKRLFLNAVLQCNQYDSYANNADCQYDDDTDNSLNGYDGFDREKIFYNGGDGMKFFSLNHNRTAIQRVLVDDYHIDVNEHDALLTQVFQFLAADQKQIIIPDGEANAAFPGYVLNLNDVRFAPGDGKLVDSHDIQNYYRIEEHTAQLSSSQGRIHQNMFASGAVNILSCSTTFEMGVDLGNLNCVFMNNMPPMVSNYKQRAGRAGRRPGSASYVLTLIGGSPHDLYYKSNPHELFFGKVDMPRVHLDIPSFKYRHMRAEALHSFLVWWRKRELTMHRNRQEQKREWRTCDNFFGGNNPVLAGLAEWLGNEDEMKQLKRRCCGICCVEDLGNYHPAEDLCFQLQADYNAPEYFHSEPYCLQLGGAHLWNGTDSWSKPLQTRYNATVNGLARNAAAADAVKERQITAYFAETGVLPKYGFPSDVIQLYPDRNERAADKLSLSRDVRQGLFEYAPSMTVIADKREYKSGWPLLWTPEAQRGAEMYQLAGVNRYLWECVSCKLYFLDDDKDSQNDHSCPHCNCNSSEHRPIRAIRPDAFQARESTKAKAFTFNSPVKKMCLYAGGVSAEAQKDIAGTNLRIAASQNKAIIYINKYHGNVDGQVYDALVHTVRSEAALWTMSNNPLDWDNDGNPFNWSPARTAAAWESALQAIIKASAIVNATPARDLDGQVVNIANKRYIVLFDGGSGASTSILKLVVGDENQGADNTHVEKLSKDILMRAYWLCKDCKCCKCDDGEVEPQDAGIVYALDAGVRNFRACYNCIMRYDNQNMHSKLDAYDASVILKAMWGGEPPHFSKDDENPEQGGANNTPGDGKQETDSQNSQKGGALVDATASVVVNRGVGGDASCVAEAGNEVQGQTPNNQRNTYSEREPVAAPPQPFISIEGNFTDKKNMNSSKGKEFWVRKDGRVFVDVLKRVLSDHRAVFKLAGKVAYADIMKK